MIKVNYSLAEVSAFLRLEKYVFGTELVEVSVFQLFGQYIINNSLYFDLILHDDKYDQINNQNCKIIILHFFYFHNFTILIIYLIIFIIMQD